MLRDRARLRRRIRALTSDTPSAELERLEARIDRSVELLERRRSLTPRLEYPAELPVCERRGEIAEAIASSRVVIICGETGSGKTTQLPKICLELGLGRCGMIGHTQPRRIAARSVADRIASEMRAP